jgi:protease PrsW
VERPAILVAAIAPAIAVLAYGIVKARGDWRNEALWSALLAGAVAVIAAASIEGLLGLLLSPARLPPLAGAVVSALVVAALPEETLKFVVLVFIAERHPDLRRRQDIVLAALGVAAGFAALENFFYLIAPSDWLTVARWRAVTAAPGHAVDGLAMGSLLTLARLAPGRSALRLGAAWALPVALHASYDFPLFVLQAAGRAG